MHVLVTAIVFSKNTNKGVFSHFSAFLRRLVYAVYLYQGSIYKKNLMFADFTRMFTRMFGDYWVKVRIAYRL